jgi:uncharacterized protein (UPF0297 family)
LYEKLFYFLILFYFFSCKKNDLLNSTDVSYQIESPTVLYDKYFPNRILKFNSTVSIKSFWDKLTMDKDYANKIVPHFKTLQNKFEDYRLKSENENLKTNKEQASLKSSSTTFSLLTEITNSQVSNEEYLYDMDVTLLPEESLACLLNTDLQVIVSDTLYTFTRIGLFKVNFKDVSDFANIRVTNQDNILYNPHFNSISTETPIGNNQYLVQDGIVRQSDATNNLFQRIDYIDDRGGYSGGGYGGSGGVGSPGNLIPDYYVNSTVQGGFQKEVGVVFNDWAKRRLVFKLQNVDISIFGWGFHKIDIKAKVQREKRFLWFTYWGESFADELIVGCDNMNLQTDYIFPHPQDFSVLTRPSFEGLADYQIGNWVVNTVGIKVNLSALGFSLNNSQVSSFLNNQFNSVIGNTYNNIFKVIENNLLNSIDPNYLSRYANYTKRVNSLDAQYKLKWIIGYAEKPQGYSHENTWTFDWNIGGGFSTNGGVTGGYPAKYDYSYEMKGGSFFGRARVGNVWHGIRVVKI